MPVLKRRAGELAWMLGARVALLGANAVLQLFLAHRMEVRNYGIVVAAIGAQLFASRLLLIGMDAGMLRLRSVPELAARSREVVRAGVWAIAILSGVVLALAMLAGPLIPLRDPRWPAWAWTAAVAGAAGTALIDYSLYYELSELRYAAAALWPAAMATCRCLLAGSAAWLFPGSPAAVFGVYAVAGLVVSAAHIPTMMARRYRLPDWGIMRRLLAFSSPNGGADVLAVLNMHQGTFLLAGLGMGASTGVFGLALTLSLGFQALGQAFFQQIFPRMVRIKARKEFMRFLRNTSWAAGAMTLACVPPGVAIGVVLPRYLPPEFAGITPVFFWLTASMLLGIAQAPLKSASLYLLRPSLMVVTFALRVAVTGAMGIALVGSHGAAGVAFAQFAGALAGMAVLGVPVVLTAMRRGIVPVADVPALDTAA